MSILTQFFFPPLFEDSFKIFSFFVDLKVHSWLCVLVWIDLFLKNDYYHNNSPAKSSMILTMQNLFWFSVLSSENVRNTFVRFISYYTENWIAFKCLGLLVSLFPIIIDFLCNSFLGLKCRELIWAYLRIRSSLGVIWK